jgi:spoIIIJ-associated protein
MNDSASVSAGQRGKQWLEELLRLAKFTAQVHPEARATVAVQEIDEDEEQEPANYWLNIDGANLTPAQIEILIGSNGGTLDAIQYLANATLNLGQEKDDQGFYTIELEGYRQRRQAELQALAESAAQQVRETGQEFEMKSLSAAERRQIHNFLQDCEDLETYSRGQEPDRRLIVKRR